MSNAHKGGRMGRRNADKELDQLQRLKYENQKLKKENSRLRKLIQRGQADQDLLQELIEKQNAEVELEQQEKVLKNKWGCHECNEGVLKIHIMKRLDGVFYWRLCSNPNCGHKTKLQRYTKDVEGIKHESAEDT
jgi:hypothetical protein